MLGVKISLYNLSIGFKSYPSFDTNKERIPKYYLIISKIA